MGQGKNEVDQVPSPSRGRAFAMAPDFCQCLRIGNKPSDPTLMSLLEGQSALIKSLTEKVNNLSEAPTRSEKTVPPLCLKELHDLALVWNHPQWVTRVLYYLKCAILKEALPLDSMRMTPKWDDEAQKPLLFNLSDEQKKDTTVWTEVVRTGCPHGWKFTPPPSRCCLFECLFFFGVFLSMLARAAGP